MNVRYREVHGRLGFFRMGVADSDVGMAGLDGQMIRSLYQ